MGSRASVGMAGPLAGFAPGFGAELVAAGVSAGLGGRAAVVDGGRERVAGRAWAGGG